VVTTHLIVAITPNPALDLSGLVEKIVPNEKNYIQAETRSPGGNAINAARIIQRLGYPVIASGFLGGSTGFEVRKLLDDEKVKQKFIKIGGNTRINVTAFSLKTHIQTRLSFPGPNILADEARSLLEFVKHMRAPSLLIVGGSLPSGFQVSWVRKLMVEAKAKHISTVVDIPGSLLKHVVSSKPILIKPNLAEFQQLVGNHVTSVKGVIRASRKVLDRVQLVCVSSVDGGALLISRQGVWFGKCPKMKIKTTIGAGDSMVGAMCTRIYKNLLKISLPEPVIQFNVEEVGDILRWGLAAASATLTHSGTMLGNKKEIKKYYPQIKLSLISV
jgi:1-phosphofructokinase family hexose kinase